MTTRSGFFMFKKSKCGKVLKSAVLIKFFVEKLCN
nr:MAG TPA: hypothetical protein [Caudoviricetes sp.]